MKLLSHPNLVKLLGVCTTGEPVYIVMELMIHGKKLYMWMLLIPFIHPCQQCTGNQTIRICQSFLSNFRYLNRELNRTKLLGSYGFFPKATWFRLLNGNEDDYDDDNDQKRANYQGKYIFGLSRNQLNVTLVGSENFFHRCAKTTSPTLCSISCLHFKVIWRTFFLPVAVLLISRRHPR